jgi:hypothetical protein
VLAPLFLFAEEGEQNSFECDDTCVFFSTVYFSLLNQLETIHCLHDDYLDHSGVNPQHDKKRERHS